ncbi:MAG: aldehyde dehydrogenase [Bacteroidetes bacterium]|nr:MAG: aldehyde dehydrogenase [Bacteroidota bacterium]TAG88753.1 MAG: aldehyde dehydrogenase [Bacteroidota bacterium]
MERIFNFIDGQYMYLPECKYLDNYAPATGEIYALTPDSTEEDLELAIQAAENAFPIWSKMTSIERSNILLKISALIEQNLEEFAKAESKDTGKPISLARKMDIPRSVENFKFFATAILHTHTPAHATEFGVINYTLRKPLGIVACISPWNLPLYLFTWKIAPALASGNCVIGKPSEVTPFTAYMLGKICQEAGLPKGVLNILHGQGGKIGAKLVAHPKIKAVSFTGGTQTGAEVARLAAPQFKKISLELGGKNPTIIFADANYEKALENAVKSSFTNQGQICLCGSRIFIEKKIYEKFKTDFIEKIKLLKIGLPNDENTEFGAVVSLPHLQKVMTYIELAKAEGGTILIGGERIKMENEAKNGYYLAPTLIENLPFDCRTNQEEIFGAVVTIMPFETKEEVLMYANSVKYGLSASVWTSNLETSNFLAQHLDVGIVWINTWLLRDLRTSFGGMKHSGVGREGGQDSLLFFTEPKNICIKMD